MDEAEERSDATEQALQKARQRARGASQAATRTVSHLLNVNCQGGVGMNLLKET